MTRQTRQSKHKSNPRLALVAGIISTLLMSAALSGLVQAAPGALPPRPPTHTPQPTPASQPTAAPARPAISGGAQIELRVQFPQAGIEYHWQELWTVVEWQDEFGVWREVEGWQGTLDEVVNSVGESVKGKKTWWVSGGLLGKGPFRWLVYRPEQAQIAKSELFYLPEHEDMTLVVETSLAP